MKFYTPAEIEKEKDLYTDYVNSHHGDALENATVYASREFDEDNNVVSFYLGIEDANGHDTGSGLDERHAGKAALETYYVVETQNNNSIRKAEKIKVKSLTAAKRHATRNQVYQSTVLTIFSDIDENGYGINELTSKDTGFSNRNQWT
jgi:hypothetical protein